MTPGNIPRDLTVARRSLRRLGLWSVVAAVWAYRLTLGPWLGGHCRFAPSCSQYMLDAVHRHGPWRGAWRGLRRILRCHPWGGQGYDPA